MMKNEYHGKENAIPVVVWGGITLYEVITAALVASTTVYVVNKVYNSDNDFCMPYYSSQIDFTDGGVLVSPSCSELPLTSDGLTIGGGESIVIPIDVTGTMTGTDIMTESTTGIATGTRVGGDNSDSKKGPFFRRVLTVLGGILLLGLELFKSLGAFGIGLLAIILTLILQGLRWLISKRDDEEEESSTVPDYPSERIRMSSLKHRLGFN